jgi:putative DNA primase/helicase
MELAKSEPGVSISPNQLDANPWLLGCANGVIELNTGIFREGRRDDYITKQLGIPYRSGATCPNWLAFLDTVTEGGTELQAYIQRAFGYTLTASVREEVMFILYGGGSNGKTTFREVLRLIMGDYALTASSDLLMERKQGAATNDLARLKGARLVSVNESQENDQLNEAIVKAITSNEPITARFLYAEWFDFYPTHKLWMATNHKPVVKGTDDGIWRRLHFIPFIVQIPPDKKEADFRQRRLEPELSGILNWALEGVRAYLAEGLNPPDVVRAATSDYRREMDVVGDWLQERTLRTPEAQVPAADLFADYEAWAEQNCGWTYSSQRLGRQLRERGFVPAKDRGIRVWRGLYLKSQVSTPGLRVVGQS